MWGRRSNSGNNRSLSIARYVTPQMTHCIFMLLRLIDIVNSTSSSVFVPNYFLGPILTHSSSQSLFAPLPILLPLSSQSIGQGQKIRKRLSTCNCSHDRHSSIFIRYKHKLHRQLSRIDDLSILARSEPVRALSFKLSLLSMKPRLHDEIRSRLISASPTTNSTRSHQQLNEEKSLPKTIVEATNIGKASNAKNDGETKISPRGISKYPAIRLNKVFKATHSRRQADGLIQQGRVSVNGVPISLISGSATDGIGMKVTPFLDEISLDGNIVTGWEVINGFTPPMMSLPSQVPSPLGATRITDGVSYVEGPKVEKQSKSPYKNESKNDSRSCNNSTYQYVKYWKPRGVVCTTDRNVPKNIIDELARDGYVPPHRVFSVGRLDKDTSGLILITSDGRLPNSVLSGKAKQPKTYWVTVDKRLETRDLERLRNGVQITTTTKRDKQVPKAITASTLPSIVQPMGAQSLKITIFEGRNRQIRKMMEALGYRVRLLHREEFIGIKLPPLKKAGDWAVLEDHEMKLIDMIIFNCKS